MKDIITYDLEGTIQINGKPLTVEQAIVFREGAEALKNNWAYNVIQDQVRYEAVKMGVHSSVTFDMLYMSKAAIWLQEQEKRILNEIV